MDYLESINLIYLKKNNIYINPYYFNKDSTNTNTQIIKKQNIVKTSNNTKLKLSIKKSLLSSNKDKLFGRSTDINGNSHIKNKNIKEGPCLEPYKIWGQKDNLFYGCNYHDKKSPKELGKICATEINSNPPKKVI